MLPLPDHLLLSTSDFENQKNPRTSVFKTVVNIAKITFLIPLKQILHTNHRTTDSTKLDQKEHVDPSTYLKDYVT